MPLRKGSGQEAVSENVKTEMAHGKPQKQAVAIALSEAGLSNKDNVPPDPAAALSVAGGAPDTVTAQQSAEVGRKYGSSW